MDKGELRKEMKARIATMSSEEKAREAGLLFDRLEQLPEFAEARCVLAYWSLCDEPNTHSLLSRWAQQKRVLLPAVVGNDLELRQYRNDDDLAVGAFGIKEPIGEKSLDYDEVDLVIVPGLSFDSLGFRLGRGKGYYDRLLPRLAASTIGVCFSCQYSEQLPHDEWDIPMRKVLY